jgi:hypothetical protein
VAKTEILLNLAWALVCFGALSAQVWMDGLRSRARDRKIRVRRSLSVLIAALALFPVISASDDRVRLADLNATPAQETALQSGKIQGLLSAAPLEDPEHGRTAEPLFATVVVCFFLIPRTKGIVQARWFSISAVGRAPPVLA